MFEDRRIAPLFELGRVVSTPGALEALQENQVAPLDLLARHANGDWGDLDPEDVRSNEAALNQGGRLFSAYNLPGKERVWIITEWDRSSTTFLLPEEY